MGGRGTFASGKETRYTYETVGMIEGVKVLQKLDKKASGGLPEEAHLSSAYIMLNKNGDFRMYREYDKNHYLKFEIAYHPEKDIDLSRKPVLHVHEYKPNDFSNRKARPLTKEEYNKYKKYFKGGSVNGMSIGSFMDKVYHGDEIEFIFNGTTYFLQGYMKGNKYVLTVDYWNKTDGTEPKHDYLFEIECDSPEERMLRFEEAAVFMGKTIYDVEKNVTVLYG